MERQLKERLIGAAVLIAVAAIMVPEMFSGTGSHHDDSTSQLPVSGSGSNASSESGQIKTYRIELQQHPQSVVPTDSVPAQAMPVVPDTRVDAAPANPPPMAQNSSSSSITALNSSRASSTPSFSASQPVLAGDRAAHSSVHSSTRSAASTQPHGAVHEPAPAASPVMGSGWSVQLGSFAAESTAREVASGAKSHGFSAYLVPVRVGGKTLYRVRIGPFADRGAAASALSKLRHAYPQAALAAPNH
ncbi:MAG: SPOR domain-containing protein [Steroidobacter sp.]